MSVVVAYKWAADPQDAGVRSDGTVDWSRAKPSMSGYDPVAVQLGRGLADALGTELVGVSVGSGAVATTTAKKAALSRGFDRLTLVADDALAGAGSTRTGLVLAAVVRGVPDVAVVLTGDASVDVGAQMVPAVLAGALGWPLLTGVTAVSGAVGHLTVERRNEGGTQVLAVTGPAVLAVAVDAVQPKVPGIRDILAAGRRPSEEIGLGTLALPELASVAVTGTSRPRTAARKGEVIDGSDPAAAAAKLVAALRAANVLGPDEGRQES